MKSDEYVPTKTPTMSANTNPRIVAPPKMKIASRVTKVVPEVLRVRASVEQSALLIFSRTLRFG